ncbi:5677_t:CDS:2 [Entrophospora sp. SA101]|nr:5677_t:CDS:2 [Entrophospora sp. SA101]
MAISPMFLLPISAYILMLPNVEKKKIVGVNVDKILKLPDTDDINKSIIENNIDSIKNETDDHREAANFEYELGSSDGDLYNNDGVTNAITSQETRGNIDMANIGSNNNELCNVENIKIETIIKKFHHQILFCQPVNGDNNVNNQQTSHDQANDDDESWLRRAIEFEVRAGKVEFEAELKRLNYNLDNDLDNDGTTIPIESPTGLDSACVHHK